MSIQAFFTDHVVLAAAVTVLAQQLGIPVPTLPTLTWAGALTFDKPLLAALAFLLSTVAGAAGDLPWYCAGRRYGYQILRLACRVTLSPDSCVRQARCDFERNGPVTLILARFVPGLSAVAAPLAGASRLRISTFLLYELAGSVLKAAAGLALGVGFHDQSLLSSNGLRFSVRTRCTLWARCSRATWPIASCNAGAFRGPCAGLASACRSCTT